jgi:hypothetical protein
MGKKKLCIISFVLQDWVCNWTCWPFRILSMSWKSIAYEGHFLLEYWITKVKVNKNLSLLKTLQWVFLVLLSSLQLSCPNENVWFSNINPNHGDGIMRNCIYWNHITLQLKLKKKNSYTIVMQLSLGYYNYYANYPLRNTMYQ